MIETRFLLVYPVDGLMTIRGDLVDVDGVYHRISAKYAIQPGRRLVPMPDFSRITIAKPLQERTPGKRGRWKPVVNPPPEPRVTGAKLDAMLAELLPLALERCPEVS